MMVPVHGLLLAGGEGSRLGGVDKGWVALAGRPLVQHVLARLRPQVQTLTISANRHLEQYAALGYPVLSDAPAWQGMGPLAALATLSAHRQAPQQGYVQLCPCDTPLVPLDLVRRLQQELLQNPTLDVVYPQNAHGPQPALMLAQCSALASVPAYLVSGQRSLRGWLATRQAQPVFFDNELAFANANDPQALQGLEQLFAHDA